MRNVPIITDENPTTYEILENIDNFTVDTWFERDRASVILKLKDGITVNEAMPDLPEWWDEDVHEAVEDGFLDPKDWLGSAHEHFIETILPAWQESNRGIDQTD